MTRDMCEIFWMYYLLEEILPVKLCCNNQDGIQFSSDLAFYEWKKQKKCHSLRKKNL